MKKTRLIILFGLLTLGLLLSACAGGRTQTTSWPGLTVDPDGEVGYVASGSQVYAVNLVNGTEKWRFPAESDNNITFYAPPALTDDGQLIVGGYNSLLYSLNPENGQQNWVWDGADPSQRYVAGPLADSEQIYAPSSDKNLYSLDMNGSLLWTYTTEDALWGTPTKDGEVVFLPGMDHSVYALNAQTGRLVWKTDPLGGSVAGNPTLNPDGQLYVGTFNNELLSLNSENGQIIWRMPAANWVWSGPTQDGGTLYVGDLEGNFYSVDAETGTIVWKIQPDPDNESAIVEKPLVLDDTVYFTSENGSLYAVDAANGNPLWSKEVGGKLYAGPQAGAETILVAPLNADELLVAFDPNGVQKWVFIPAE